MVSYVYLRLHIVFDLITFGHTAPLAKHLESEGVSFLQFSFRWFHLLFLRVLPVNSVIRMWDTYMVSVKFPLAKNKVTDEGTKP